ncbi:hypothetical protein JW859_01140 [bacterium]|nr:hypothetical protein [bacterium]
MLTTVTWERATTWHADWLRAVPGAKWPFLCMYTDLLKLEEELDEFLRDFGFQAVDLNIAGRGPGRVFRLFVDSIDPVPVTIDDCTALSPQVRLFLEMKGVYNDKSSLEVSSGGLDRVLKRDRDFERFLGYEVRVAHLSGPKKETVTGELSSFTDDFIVVTIVEGGEPRAHKIQRSALDRVNLVPKLEL